MRNQADLSALRRALDLLEAVVADAGRSSLARIAREEGIPVATAHRHAAALVEEGWLMHSGHARLCAGSRLRSLSAMLDERQIMANVAGPILQRLAARLKCVVQLGTFDGDMVTYRIKAGERAGELFTKVGMQLEAYCSGMGKVLLAGLSVEERERYLAGGPFIALTPNTVTDPALLRAELERVTAQGYAEDREEVVMGLRCMAVPLRTRDGRVIAAISASQALAAGRFIAKERLLPLLLRAAEEIEALA